LSSSPELPHAGFLRRNSGSVPTLWEIETRDSIYRSRVGSLERSVKCCARWAASVLIRRPRLFPRGANHVGVEPPLRRFCEGRDFIFTSSRNSTARRKWPTRERARGFGSSAK